MAAFGDIIRALFAERPACTIAEACDRIEKLTGIRRSPTQVRPLPQGPGIAVAPRPGDPGAAKGDSQVPGNADQGGPIHETPCESSDSRHRHAGQFSGMFPGSARQ